MDYPFTSWKTYYAALTQSLKTDAFVKTYPQYGRYQEDTPYSEVKIVEELLKSQGNPQEALDGFVQSLLEGGRYALEMKPSIKKIIKLFIEAGAKPNVDCLFDLKYPEEDHFEDEVTSGYYKVRGFLIDVFSEYGIDVYKYYDWAAIDYVYWEDIDQKIVDEDYQKACFMVLKYYSEYLIAIEEIA
jgi:hypothetical protein